MRITKSVWLAVFGSSMLVSAVFAAEGTEQKMDPQMEAWMKSIQPGPEHAWLAKSVGTWKLKVSMWMDPSQPPEVSESTSEKTMAMGGRYLIEKIKGMSMGMPFEGMGTTAFDKVDKKFHGTWIDNFGTGFMVSEGTCDAAFKLCTYTATMNDPMSGQALKARMEEVHTDGDHYSFEMYSPGPDGKEVRNMRIDAARVK